jgi:hypothetical protein
VIIESATDFLDKTAKAIDVVRGEVPACCRSHQAPPGR